MSKLLQSFTIILAPLYILRAHFLIPITFLEVLLIITFIATFFDFLKDKRPLKSLHTNLNFIILFFAAAAFLEIFVSPNLIGGLGIYKAYFLEPIIFFYCLLYTGSKYGYGYIVNSFLLSALWTCLIALVQKITGRFSLAPYEIVQGRIPALYNSANSLALFLGPLAILTFGLFSQDISKKRWWYLSLFLFISTVVIWTKSRGGEISVLLSLAIFGVITAFTHFKKLMNFKNAFLIVLVFLIVGAGTLFYRTTNFFPVEKNKAYTQGDTLQIRYFIWEGTINLLKDHPFFGAGLDGFKTLYSNNYRPREYQEEVQYPHNIILTFWAETGGLGLVGFLLVIISSFVVLFRGLMRSNYLFLGISIIGAFSYILIHGVVDVPYFKNDLSLEFWVFVALTILWSKKGTPS